VLNCVLITVGLHIRCFPQLKHIKITLVYLGDGRVHVIQVFLCVSLPNNNPETLRFCLRLFRKLSSGGGRQRFFLSGGWMHNNLEFVLRDDDIQVWWGNWYSYLSWGWAFVSFHMFWGWRSQKIAAHLTEDNFWNSP